MELTNKTVLITGASKGIGAATALAFAQAGSSVIINYKSDTKAAQDILAQCNQHSTNNLLIQSDITQESEVKTMLQTIKTKCKHLDILINNAGIFDERDSPTNIDAFTNTFNYNLLSVFMVTKYTLELMKTGKIINVSSIHGRLGHGRPTAIAYSAFKAALNSYTQNLAKDLAPKILVNAIAPGRVATPMWGDNLDAAQQTRLGQVHLIKRMIQPSEIADSILFLARNDAMCGEILTIDGGMGLLDFG